MERREKKKLLTNEAIIAITFGFHKVIVLTLSKSISTVILKINYFN
jgi:hypothetical protein